MLLRKTGASLSFFFGEPVTKVTTEAALKIAYAAPDLRPNEARLLLTLNGVDVESIALAPGFAQQTRVNLPTDLLTNENTLSIELQGTCSACTVKRGPWVTIDPSSRSS